MPATITQSPIDVERKDPGSGGRPPVHRRPTGGGGGDENWGRDQSRRGPEDLLTRCRMGLGAVLAGDLIFFFCLILAFYAKQHASHIQMEERIHSRLEPAHGASNPLDQYRDPGIEWLDDGNGAPQRLP